MLAVLTGARRAVLKGAMALVAAAVAVLSLAGVAHAEYSNVASPLQQWLWVRSDGGAPITAAAVRGDGWLVAATSQRVEGERLVGGNLLLVAPWSGSGVPFGDAPNPATGNHSFTSLVARGEKLFGLTSIPDEHSRVGQRATLVELSARTGKVLATHGTWWFPDLAVDPQTGDLVLWNFRCTGQCDGADYEEQTVDVVSHQLVRYNPDTRKTTAVLVPDAAQANAGGSGTCASRRDTLHNCEEVFRVAFSANGSALFLGTARNGSNAIDVRDRTGAFRFSIPVARPVDSMRFGAPGTCFDGALVYTAFDGTTWLVDRASEPAAASSGARVIASGGPAGASGTTQTVDGMIVSVRRSEGVVIACPGWGPPTPPKPAATPVASLGSETAAKLVSTASAQGPAGGPPPGSPPAPPGNVAPPLQPPAVPAVAGPASHATQAVTSVNVGLADVQEEQPVYSLSASRRSPDPAAWASLAIGATAAVGFSVVALIAIPAPRRERSRAAFVRIERPR